LDPCTGLSCFALLVLGDGLLQGLALLRLERLLHLRGLPGAAGLGHALPPPSAATGAALSTGRVADLLRGDAGVLLGLGRSRLERLLRVQGLAASPATAAVAAERPRLRGEWGFSDARHLLLDSGEIALSRHLATLERPVDLVLERGRISTGRAAGWRLALLGEGVLGLDFLV